MEHKPKRFGPGAKNARVVEKAKDFKGTTKKLVKDYLSQYKLKLIIVFIFAIGSTIFDIVGPKILGNATTEIFNGLISKISGGSGIDFGKIGGILITLLILYVISTFFSLIQGFTMTHVAQKLTYRLRTDLVKKINKLPMSYFDKKTNGEVLSIRYSKPELKPKCYTNYNINMHNYRNCNNDDFNKCSNDINININTTNFRNNCRFNC